MAAITITPASGSITAKLDFCRIDVTDADQTVRARVKATKSGETDLVSHEFQPNADGDHTWFNLMFPSAGTWALTLYKTSDNSTIVTTNVTVA